MQAVKMVSGSFICWYLIHNLISEAQDLMSRLSLLSFSIPLSSFFNSLKLITLLLTAIGLGIEEEVLGDSADSEEVFMVAMIEDNNIKSRNLFKLKQKFKFYNWE